MSLPPTMIVTAAPSMEKQGLSETLTSGRGTVFWLGSWRAGLEPSTIGAPSITTRPRSTAVTPGGPSVVTKADMVFPIRSGSPHRPVSRSGWYVRPTRGSGSESSTWMAAR